jgi:hypothetical protein
MPYGLTIQRFMVVTPPSYAFQALKCRFWALIRPAGRASFGSSNEGLASPFLLSQSAADAALEQFSTPLCTRSQFIPLDRMIPAFQCSPSLPSTIDGTCRGDTVVCRSGYRSLQGFLFAPSSSAHEAPAFFFGTPSRFSTMRWPRIPGVAFSQWNVTSSLCSLIVHTLASVQEA